MLSITRHPLRFCTTSKRTLSILRHFESSEATASSSIDVSPSKEWYTSDRTPLDGAATMPGLMHDTNTLTSLPLPNLATVTRDEALDYFDNTWVLMEELFTAFRSEEAFLVPPYHGLRHPMVFYYGHPTVFYVNKLRLAGVLSEPVNEYYEEIFEVGVDEMSWDDMSKNDMEWPEISDITTYRRSVYQLVKDVILTHPELAPNHAQITPNSALWSLFMSFEHDRIHLETSSVLMRELPLEHLRKPKYWPSTYPVTTRKRNSNHPVAGVDYPASEWIAHPGGNVKVGKQRNFPSFGWDNEYGERTVNVGPFRASKFMVTNGEFLEFVKSGGYHEQSFWSEEGWKWKMFRNTKWPTFWRKHGPAGLHQYKLRVLFDEIDMQWDWPVEVNHLEAQAYCRWKEKQDNVPRYHLTTEAIHHLLRDGVDAAKDYPKSDAVMLQSKGRRMSESHGTNLNLSYASCSPVTAFAPNDQGFHDVTGNAWELSEDCFAALPGFQVHPIYDDFSTPCFDGEHNMIMGGSFLSTGDNGASVFSRYHFRKHFFQHSGFRLIQSHDDQDPVTTCLDAPGPYAKPNPYRTSSASKNAVPPQPHQLAVASHFGQDSFDEIFHHVNAPARVANFVFEAFKTHATTPSSSGTRVVDIGCGVGGVALQLASKFDKVVGIDNDPKSVELAKSLHQSGKAEHAELKDKIETDRVEFYTADAAMDLPEHCQQQAAAADVVLVFHVLESMGSPKECLERLQHLVRPGGILIVGMEQQHHDDSTIHSSLTTHGFEYVDQSDLPVYSRDEPRSCRVTMLNTTIWRRCDAK